jgi:ribonuclease BN (tRNA processing enzyme)
MNLRLVGFLLVLGVAVASWVVTCGTWRVSKVASGVVPLDAREFEHFTVVTVGTGGAYENPDRVGPATAVALGSQVLLVDAGRAVAEGLRAVRIPVAQPRAILLTNLLPENTVGLDDLLLTGWLEGRSEPLRLYGPPGTRALASALTTGHRRGIEGRARALGLPRDGARFEVGELEGSWSERIGEIEVWAGALPGGPLQALAYRFEVRGRSAVVAGSGWAPDALIEFARGAHLLVHEATFVPGPELSAQLGLDDRLERLEREAALHTQIGDVGELARRAGIETLALVRLRPPPAYDLQLTSIVGEAFDGRIVVADDGDELRP